MRAIMALFGAVLGLMLVWVGVAMSQDLVLGAEVGGCVPNPIVPGLLPDFCLGAGATVTITGVGWFIFMSMMILIVIGFVITAFVFFFVPSLRGGMPAFASFAVLLMATFIVGFFVALRLMEAFGW